MKKLFWLLLMIGQLLLFLGSVYLLLSFAPQDMHIGGILLFYLLFSAVGSGFYAGRNYPPRWLVQGIRAFAADFLLHFLVILSIFPSLLTKDILTLMLYLLLPGSLLGSLFGVAYALARRRLTEMLQKEGEKDTGQS